MSSECVAAPRWSDDGAGYPVVDVADGAWWIGVFAAATTPPRVRVSFGGRSLEVIGLGMSSMVVTLVASRGSAVKIVCRACGTPQDTVRDRDRRDGAAEGPSGVSPIDRLLKCSPRELVLGVMAGRYSYTCVGSMDGHVKVACRVGWSGGVSMWIIGSARSMHSAHLRRHAERRSLGLQGRAFIVLSPVTWADVCRTRSSWRESDVNGAPGVTADSLREMSFTLDDVVSSSFRVGGARGR